MGDSTRRLFGFSDSHQALDAVTRASRFQSSLCSDALVRKGVVVSFIKIVQWQRFAGTILGVWLLASCGGSDSSSPAKVVVPNVVGMAQAAATASITGVGLKVGTVTMASSASVASGSVISENPAAATSVPSGSAVDLTVSSGQAQVSVPNVVGLTQAAATTSITGAGLTLGTVTTSSSATVPSGSVISENPAASTSVAAASAVNLTVSSGAVAHFAYVSNAGDGTLSAYSINSLTGALTALSGSPIAVPGSGQLYETKIDPAGKFLYVVDDSSPGKVYAFSIDQNSGMLTAVTGSPFAAGNGSQSLAFDATGSYLYVANFSDNTISGYSLDKSTGALAPLANSPYTALGINPQPSQIATAGSYLYVADSGTNIVEFFAIAAGTGELSRPITETPATTDTAPLSLAVNSSGSVLYTANAGSGQQGSISAFTVNSSSGALSAVAGNPLAIAARGYISIDPQGKYLFVPELVAGTNGISVYSLDSTTGVPGTAVAGSPFATGSNAYSVSVDPTGQFVYVGNDGSANVSEFALNRSTGALTPVAGSPVPAGANPDFVAIK
jgi:6-phosphogluconolactonase